MANSSANSSAKFSAKTPAFGVFESSKSQKPLFISVGENCFRQAAAFLQGLNFGRKEEGRRAVIRRAVATVHFGEIQ